MIALNINPPNNHINLPPIVHNLPQSKPPMRKVFTFAGIQSLKGVTYDRDTDTVYNNIHPESLACEEDPTRRNMRTILMGIGSGLSSIMLSLNH